MAQKKFKRGHHSIETKAIQKRYVGFFKARRIKIDRIPYLILAGISHTKREALTDLCTMEDVALVLRNRSTVSVSDAKKELIAYINHELPFIKEYKFDAICNLLRIGATLLKGKKTEAGIPWYRAHILKNAHHRAKYGKLMRYILNGQADTFWYENTKRAFEAFLPGYDTELFIKLFAMTSPRTNFASNIKLALKGYDMFVGKTKFEKNGFLSAVFSILKQFHDGTFDFKLGIRGPKRKITSFRNSISGGDSVTADMWITMVFGLLSYYTYKGKRYPYTIRDSEYDIIEKYLRSVAACTGLKAKHINAMLWLGIRQEEYDRHDTSDSATLLIKTLKKYGDEVLKENALNKVIMTTPVHTLDANVECLDYSKPERERVYVAKNSKEDSNLYRTFDGTKKRHCSGCSEPDGCVMCLLP